MDWNGKIVRVVLVLFTVIPMASAGERVIKTSFCSLVQHPRKYKGKMVQFRTQITQTFSAYEDCKYYAESPIVIAYPGGSREIQMPFRLIRDADFEKFEYYLRAEPLVKQEPPPGWVSSRPPRRYCKITVTLTGLFEAVSEEEALRGRGFGNGGRNQFQLVLHRVANPVAEECPPVPRPPPKVVPPLPPSLILKQDYPPPPESY
jgi:hypothetical protein